MRIPIEWVLGLFYAGVGLVLIAMGTPFGRRHRVIGLLGLSCAIFASGAGVVTYMLLLW